MSKLQEVTGDGNVKGWQWEDGPIFLGEDGHRWAIEYGKALMRQGELKAFAKLLQEQYETGKRLEALEKKRNET